MSIVADLVTQRKAGGFTRVYAVNAVPASPSYPYVVIGYAPNAPQVRSNDGSGDPLERFTVQHFSRTADGIEAIAADTFAIFDGQPVGAEVCWQEIATPVFRDPDDNGVLTITHTYRY